MGVAGWGFVVVGVAGFRIWRLFARDSLLDRPRAWLAEHYPRVFGWVDCPWCSGFWIVVGVAWAWESGMPIVNFGIGVFAAAGVASLLSTLIEQGD